MLYIDDMFYYSHVISLLHTCIQYCIMSLEVKYYNMYIDRDVHSDLNYKL